MARIYRYLVISLFLFLAACTSKVTQENFSKIQNGMSMRQVTQILGTPVSVDSINIAGISGASAVWKDKDTVITIQFLNNKVQIKTFTKANDSSAPGQINPSNGNANS